VLAPFRAAAVVAWRQPDRATAAAFLRPNPVPAKLLAEPVAANMAPSLAPHPAQPCAPRMGERGGQNLGAYQGLHRFGVIRRFFSAARQTHCFPPYSPQCRPTPCVVTVPYTTQFSPPMHETWWTGAYRAPRMQAACSMRGSRPCTTGDRDPGDLVHHLSSVRRNGSSCSGRNPMSREAAASRSAEARCHPKSRLG